MYIYIYIYILYLFFFPCLFFSTYVLFPGYFCVEMTDPSFGRTSPSHVCWISSVRQSESLNRGVCAIFGFVHFTVSPVQRNARQSCHLRSSQSVRNKIAQSSANSRGWQHSGACFCVVLFTMCKDQSRCVLMHGVCP